MTATMTTTTIMMTTGVGSGAMMTTGARNRTMMPTGEGGGTTEARTRRTASPKARRGSRRKVVCVDARPSDGRSCPSGGISSAHECSKRGPGSRLDSDRRGSPGACAAARTLRLRDRPGRHRGSPSSGTTTSTRPSWYSPTAPSSIRYRARPGGRIDPEGLEQKLTTRLSQGLVRNPQVTVVVQEYRSNTVFVVGEFAPGRPPYLGPDGARAGAGERRPDPGGRRRGRDRARPPVPPCAGRCSRQLGRDSARTGPTPGHPCQGPRHRGRRLPRSSSSDRRHGFVTQAARVFVTGEVRNPGAIALPGDATRQLINIAGGFTQYGSDGGLRVVRRRGQGQELKCGSTPPCSPETRSSSAKLVLVTRPAVAAMRAVRYIPAAGRLPAPKSDDTCRPCRKALPLGTPSYAPSPPEATDLSGYDYRLLRHWKLVLVIFLLITSLAALRALLTRPVYAATAQILIERQNPNVLGFKGVTEAKPAARQRRLLPDAVRLLQSRTLARRVVESLGLLQDPEFGGPRAQAADRRPPRPAARAAPVMEGAIDGFLGRRVHPSGTAGSSPSASSPSAPSSPPGWRTSRPALHPADPGVPLPDLLGGGPVAGRPDRGPAEEGRGGRPTPPEDQGERASSTSRSAAPCSTRSSRSWAPPSTGSRPAAREGGALPPDASAANPEELPEVMRSALVQSLRIELANLERQQAQLLERYLDQHPEVSRSASRSRRRAGRSAPRPSASSAPPRTITRPRRPRRRASPAALEAAKAETLELGASAVSTTR